MMNTARRRIGTDVFQADPRADLKGPGKRALQTSDERFEEQAASEPKQREQGRPPEKTRVVDIPESAENTLDASAELPTDRKVRFGANIPPSLKNRADNAAYWVPGLTVSKLVEIALDREIRKLEREHNGGEPFRERGQFRFGRPRASKE